LLPGQAKGLVSVYVLWPCLSIERKGAIRSLEIAIAKDERECAKSTLTTDVLMIGEIPILPSGRETAAPPCERLALNRVKRGEKRRNCKSDAAKM